MPVMFCSGRISPPTKKRAPAAHRPHHVTWQHIMPSRLGCCPGTASVPHTPHCAEVPPAGGNKPAPFSPAGTALHLVEGSGLQVMEGSTRCAGSQLQRDGQTPQYRAAQRGAGAASGGPRAASDRAVLHGATRHRKHLPCDSRHGIIPQTNSLRELRKIRNEQLLLRHCGAVPGQDWSLAPDLAKEASQIWL